MFKEITLKGLDFLFDRFERELEALQEELEELAKNRKHNILEAEAVLTADSYLEFVIERLMGYVLDGSVPEIYQEKANRLLDIAKGIRFFIYENFEDCFRNYSSLEKNFSV